MQSSYEHGLMNSNIKNTFCITFCQNEFVFINKKKLERNENEKKKILKINVKIRHKLTSIIHLKLNLYSREQINKSKRRMNE